MKSLVTLLLCSLVSASALAKSNAPVSPREKKQALKLLKENVMLKAAILNSTNAGEVCKIESTKAVNDGAGAIVIGAFVNCAVPANEGHEEHNTLINIKANAYGDFLDGITITVNYAG